MNFQHLPTQIDTHDAENILKSIRIPPSPDVVLAFMEEIQQVNVNFTKLVKLISGDVGLAASMLKTANSPFFSLRHKVTSVQQAVSVLGLKNMTQIVRASALQNNLTGEQISMERFWERSKFSAVIAAHITSHLHGVSSEDAYTLGLFHDCGIPILAQKFPHYKQTLAVANQTSQLVATIEDQHYRTNHATVGGMLARNWLLPENIAQAILVHHDHTIFSANHDHIAPEICTLVAIVQVADHVTATYLGKPADAEWKTMGGYVQNHLGLNSEDMADILETAFTELEEIRAYR